MSRLQDFDFSRFMLNDKVVVEELNIENCRISEIHCKFLRFIKCSFKNVVFENSFFEVYAYIRNCEFIGCEFYDTFEGDDVELSIGDSVFSNCLFNDVKYESFQVQSNISNCKFINCDFKNIKIEGDLSFSWLEMTGGKIEKFDFCGNQILGNTFSNVQMLEMNIKGAFIENEMKDVFFENVTVEGYNRNNTFANCNTDEFTLR